MKIAPSIIAADFTKLSREIRAVERAGGDMLHLDIMDGVFVPNITFGPMIVQAIKNISSLELDAHLMIIRPEKYFSRFIANGVKWLSFHIETVSSAKASIRFIKKNNCRAGLAVNPETPLKSVFPYLEELNFLLIMTVHPGFYGQTFISAVLKKIKKAREIIEKNNLQCLIQVDGGINGKNARVVAQAGADILVAGAAIFKASNYKKAIRQLRCSRI